MATLADGSVDALIMDPPYCSGSVSETARTAAGGQGLRSGTIARFGWFVGDNMGTAGLVWLLRAVAFEGLRAVKPSGSMLVFCDWRMLANLAPAIESTGWRYQGLIVWDKGTMGLGNGFRCQHELIMHFTAGAPEYHDKGTPNVIVCPRVGADERVHQTEKPIDLLARLVRVVAPRDGVVVDPFCGSGTTLAAALMEGRRAIGNDRAAAHVEAARARCANVIEGNPPAPVRMVQTALFGGAA